jgi:uncharacterized protein YrrD
MTDIPLGAKVECAGKICGRVTRAIISPDMHRVTHLVVREKGFHRPEHLVPFHQVLHTTRDLISMSCTMQELASMKPYIEIMFVQVEHPARDDPHPNSVFAHQPDPGWVPVKHERIPAGGLAVRRGTPVQATDGRVGRVEEFLMDPASGFLTQLVLREGHAWARKDASVPISNVSCIGERIVFLKLDKRSVESLPAVPVTRH